MSINMTHANQILQSRLDGLTTGDEAADIALLTKAVSESLGPVALSDVASEGDSQRAAVTALAQVILGDIQTQETQSKDALTATAAQHSADIQAASARATSFRPEFYYWSTL